MRYLRRSEKFAMLVLGVALCGLSAQAGKVLNDSLVTRPFRHHIWQDVLTNSVNSRGEVDFGKLRAHPLRLNQYLDQLATCSPENDPTAFPTADEKTAYWINAHNALAMRLILDQYPITSLSEVQAMETNTYYKLGGKPYSLQHIRRKLGLKAKRDVRLMFTLTDYSLGSPAILQDAYEGSNLKTLEKKATAQALKDPKVFQASAGGTCADLKLSRFFRDYERGLFSRTVASVEDRDSMEEGMVPVSFTGWTHYLRHLLSPALYAKTGNQCGGDVEFLPDAQTLRQTRL